MTPYDCQKPPKFCHTGEPPQASLFLLAGSISSPPLPGTQSSQPHQPPCYSQGVRFLAVHTSDRTSLHCWPLSPLLHHWTLLSVKALIKSYLLPRSTLWSLWPILLSSGIFTAPHWAFSFFLLAVYIFTLFSIFKFLKTKPCLICESVSQCPALGLYSRDSINIL